MGMMLRIRATIRLPWMLTLRRRYDLVIVALKDQCRRPDVCCLVQWRSIMVHLRDLFRCPTNKLKFN
jgi:hypothetical protein